MSESSEDLPPLLCLPDEILCLIFDHLGEVVVFERLPEYQPSLLPLLTPLQINRKLRALLESYRPFWRLLARNIGVVKVGHPAYQTLLQRCDDQTKHTLDAIYFRTLDHEGTLCPGAFWQRIEVIKRSQKTLRLFIVPYLQTKNICRCRECHELKDRFTPTHLQDAIFETIGQTTLDTLWLHVKEWPHLQVIEPLATSARSRPSRLQFSAMDQLADRNTAGTAFLKTLASKAEILHLSHNSEDGPAPPQMGFYRVPERSPSAPLYTSVFQSAASTLRYLEIDMYKTQLDPVSFANTSFEVVESFFARLSLRNIENVTPYHSKDGQCSMPSLKTLNVQAEMLHLIQAPAVVNVGLTIEGQKDSEVVVKALASFHSVETLVFYMDPFSQSDMMAAMVRTWKKPQGALTAILRSLVPSDKGETQLSCPSLTFLGLYNQHPQFWSTPISETGHLGVELMPRRWDWREPVDDPHDQFSVPIGPSLANLVSRRADLSMEDDSKCKALKEVRTIGFRIKRAARKPLRQAQFGFTLTYLAVPTVQEGPDGRPKHADSDFDAKSQDEDWIEEVEAKKKGKQKAIE